LLAVYLETCPQVVAELRSAVERRDAVGMQRAAHTLKGMVGHLGARVAFEAAQRLEVMGRERDLSQADAACVVLEMALDQVRPAAGRLLEDEKT
jgi:HPt (histidine-containing phosphotransfer) domain-containing protein